jgi:hypothetical protein
MPNLIQIYLYGINQNRSQQKLKTRPRSLSLANWNTAHADPGGRYISGAFDNAD